MIKRFLLHGVWIVVVIVLITYSINYKGGNDAMVAQVESQVTAISYRKPILVRKIYVSPGQVVDSGDILLEVERPDLALSYDKLINEKLQIEKQIERSEINFHNSVSILQTEFEKNTRVLSTEKVEMESIVMLEKTRITGMDSLSDISYTPDFTTFNNKISVIEDQLTALNAKYNLETDQLKGRYELEIFQYNSDLELVEMEILELEKEKDQLIKRAEKPSTIGNLFVQLNELVPPYSTLLSIYDLNPTLIKAFVHENGVKNVQIGSMVKVESIHRKYSVEGQIIEIGSRVTAFPDKINPLLNQKSYGQEIFINIPEVNNFLNGEKVFVYVIEDEE